jgi:tetratricopeptide (TPR) repeat protein
MADQSAFCRADFLSWFLGAVDAGHLAEVAQQVRAAPRTLAQPICDCFLAEERRNPMLDHYSHDQREAMPVSRLLRMLCDNYTPALVDVFDILGNEFRMYGYFSRASYLFEMVGDAYAKRNDVVPLGRSWMWRARAYSESHDFINDMPCYWRSIAIFQNLFAGATSDAERRQAAVWLSGIQHQLGTKCRNAADEETAKLYLSRAIAMRSAINANFMLGMSLGTIANCHSSLGNIRQAMLHYVRDLAVTAGSNSLSEAIEFGVSLASMEGISHENLAGLLIQLREPESALKVIAKALEKAPRFGLRLHMAQALLNLGKVEESVDVFLAAFNDKEPGSGQRRVTCGLYAVTVLERTDQEDRAAKLRPSVVDLILEEAVLLAVSEEGTQKVIEQRLGELSEDPGGQAILLHALGRPSEARDKARLAIVNQAGLTAVQRKSLQTLLSPAGARESGNPKPPRLQAQVDPLLLGSEATALIPPGMARLPDGGKEAVGLFRIDRVPVTNRLYAMYLGEEPSARVPDRFENCLWSHPDQPVTCVSYEDCAAFCRWRSKITGQSWEVPTLAEWCRAALGDDGRKYPWGDQSPNHSLAAYALITDPDSLPAPVGLLPQGQSPFGVLDMAGNVWEWTCTRDSKGRWYRMGGSCGQDETALDISNLIEHITDPVKSVDVRSPHLGFRCITRSAR